MSGPFHDSDLYRLSRRSLLQRAGAGFPLLALAGSLNAAGLLGRADAASSVSGAKLPHFAARAKRVIFLFMNGAPSHVDTFDPKPALAEHEGEQPEGAKSKGTGYMASPFKFAPRGESGVVMSELFPNLAQHADDVCVVRSMHTDVPNHEPGLLLMHCGHQQPVRPCLGAWASYGLGTENQNLPTFVALTGGLPVVGPQLWSNSFLPGEHQATAVDTNDLAVDRLVSNIRHPSLSREEQRRQLDLLLALNRKHLEEREHDAALEQQIKAMELAFEMQREAAEAFDVSREPEDVRDLYGRTTFGQSCLLARRLAERGVRFIQVYYVSKKDKQPWDTHAENDKKHRILCADGDRATAALLTDLKARGLLEDTLIVWGGEFGRTPYAQNDKDNKTREKAGRDHHNTGFTMLLAGGGVKGGLMYGATDELGMHAVENRVHVHDLHATILHVLGIDHEKLTYHYSGRDFRLTDVHGRVVHDILA
jgi:hypothetical protein